MFAFFVWLKIATVTLKHRAIPKAIAYVTLKYRPIALAIQNIHYFILFSEVL